MKNEQIKNESGPEAGLVPDALAEIESRAMEIVARTMEKHQQEQADFMVRNEALLNRLLEALTRLPREDLAEQGYFTSAVREAKKVAQETQEAVSGLQRKLVEAESRLNDLAMRSQALLERAESAEKRRDELLAENRAMLSRLSMLEERMAADEESRAELLNREKTLVQEKLMLQQRLEAMQENWERISSGSTPS